MHTHTETNKIKWKHNHIYEEHRDGNLVDVPLCKTLQHKDATNKVFKTTTTRRLVEGEK